MVRGGSRQGKPGGSYGNRSDLRTVKPATPTGQPYGANKAISDSAAALPPGAAPAGAPPMPQGAPSAGPMPGDSGDFMRPTERPNEPITAGLSVGPGAGPEALTTIPTQDDDDVDLVALAQYLPTLELMANSSTATSAGRNLVRRIRGAMPADQVMNRTPPGA